jgi:pilus assembly protein CpaC
VQFEEFGTRLNFLPIVLGNGRIHLEVEPEVSALDANAGVAIAGATVAGRATQRIHTTVELETGQTFVIGGLIQKAQNANANKVPVIGQLPFLGAAFSTKSHTDDESELIVLVTPHLVDAQSACQVSKVLPGQETRSPDDCELFLEGLLEAPRGPRAMFVNGRYIPAHLSGPASTLLPCAGQADGLTRMPHGPLFNKGHGGLNGRACPPAGGPCLPTAVPTPSPVGAPVVVPAAPVTAPVPVTVTIPAPEAATAPAVLPPVALPPTAAPAGVEAKPDGGKLSAETPGLPAVPGTLESTKPPVSVPVAGGEK